MKIPFLRLSALVLLVGSTSGVLSAPSKTQDPICERILTTRIPSIDLSGASASEAMQMIGLLYRDADPAPHPSLKGVSFLVLLRGEEEVPPSTPYAKKNVSMEVLLGDMATRFHIDIHITNVGVVVTSHGSPPFPNGKATKGEVLKSFLPRS